MHARGLTFALLVLVACEGPGPTSPPTPSAISIPSAPPATPPQPQPPPHAATPVTGDTCVVDLRSEPVAEVTLDERALGPTPQAKMTVPIGTHAVRFVRGGETKRLSFSCRAGEAKTVAVRFPGAVPGTPATDGGYGFYE